MQIPRASHRTDNIIPSLNDNRRNMPDLLDITQQLPILHKTFIYKIMAFDSRESNCEILVAIMIDHLRIDKQLRCGTFPCAPCACGSELHSPVCARKLYVVSA